MSIEEIKKKQNEPDMLQCQFVARFLYNQAEHFLTWAWIFAFVSFVAGILPSEGVIPLIVSFAADLIVALLLVLVKRDVSDAADIRGFFDNEVLGLKGNILLSEHLKDKVYTICQKHKEECRVQSENTGRDDPPGVKEWYEFGDVHSLSPVLECQKQNAWWEKHLQKKKIAAYGIAVVVVISAIILLFKISGLLNAVFSSAGFLIMTIERFVEHFRHYNCSLKMDGALEVAYETKSQDDLETAIRRIQAYINERRSIPTVGVNLLYKRNAKKLSEQYQETR